MSFISGIGSRIRAFGALAGWLVGILLHGARIQTVAAFALSLLATATHVAAIAIFLSFVHAQTTGAVFRAGPFELQASTAIPSLALWAGAVLTMALLTAVAAYSSARLTVEAGRRAARGFLRQALTVLTYSQQAHNELLSSEEGRALARRAFVSDSFILIRTSAVGIGLFAPLLLFLVAGGALLFLDPALTAAIAVPLSLFAVPFWRLNRSVVAAARRFRSFTPVRSARLKNLFEHVSRTHVSELDAPEILNETLLHPATLGAENAIGQIMLRGDKVKFLRFVFLGAVLCGLLFATGAFVSPEEQSWTSLATYAISLQYAMATMASVATSLTGIARFVPFLERMRTLTTQRPAVSPPGAAVAAVLRTLEPRLPGSLEERTLQAGDVVLCAHPSPLTTFEIPAFLERLTGRRDEADRLAVEAFFSSQPPAAMPQLEQAATGERQISEPASSYLAHLMPGLVADRHLFILDWGALAELGAEDVAAVLAQLEDRVTILATERFSRTPPLAVDAVAIMGERALVGLGDSEWLRGLDPEHELLRKFRERKRRADKETEDDPEEDLDLL